MSEPLEKTITNGILKKLRALGGWWTKIPGTRMSAGLPDIIGCHNGTFVGLEVKRPSTRNTVTERQAETLRRIAAAGGLAAVVTSREEALEALNRADEATGNRIVLWEPMATHQDG